MRQRFLTSIIIGHWLASGAVLAATYPASCPAAAQAIVEAVGGCSSVNRGSFPAVYEKCCAQVAPTPIFTPTPTFTPTPALTPAVPAPKAAPPAKTAPSPPPSKTPTPSPSKTFTPAIKKPAVPFIPPSKPIKYTEPFRDFPYFTTSTQAPSPQFKKPLEIIKENFRRVFNPILRLFRWR